MKEFAEIWDIIVRSNTFNFVLLVAIFWFLFKKINVSNFIGKLQQDIINAIENVKKSKELAGEKLSKAKDSVKNLESDIKAQMDLADNTAKTISDNILEDTEKRIEIIHSSVDKTIATEEKSLSAKLTEKTAAAAVAIAKNHIINTLKNRPDLHDKYIGESIQELDRIQL